MGREARRRQKQGPIDNRGDLDRVEAAIRACLECLKVDPRLVAAYTAWCHGRELPRLMTVRVSDRYPQHKAAAMDELIAAVVRPPSAVEVARVLYVLAGVGPDRPWPRWPAARALLRAVWPSAFYTAIQRPELTQALWVTVQEAAQDHAVVRLTYGPDTTPPSGWRMVWPGRRPRQRGHQTIAEAVTTWYRACLQDPPVSRPVLTREYTIAAARLSDAHSVVDDRIALAESLLNRWLEPEEPLKTSETH